MYQASVPVFVKALNNLSAIMTKAEAEIAARKMDPAVFVNLRLAPDMFPFSRQIQIASDVAKGCIARLAGIEIPSYPDNEATFAELHERINKTIKFIQSVKPEQIDGTDDKQVIVKAGPRELKFKGEFYLLNFALPNVFFHVTTAYAILRHNGIQIGKSDYLGDLQQ